MHNIVLIIFFNFLIHPSLAAVHLETITVTRGENVQFHCTFPQNFSSNEHIIQWQKSRPNDDDLIMAINGRIPKTFDKSYRTDLNSQSSAFEVFRVDQADSTTYICQTFETQTVLCQYNLVVLIKPEAPLLTINKTNLQEYQAVTLTCSSVNGNPPPEYTWYRNNTLLTSLTGQVLTTGNSSVYTLNVTRLDNNVKYECEISNQALAKPLRLEQYLHVKCRPYVKILEETTIHFNEQNQIKKFIAEEFHTQNFTCVYDANPPPTSIYWLMNETTIVSREKTIYIPSLTSEHSGVYTCIVENSIGRANQSIYLDVQYAPRVRAVESRVIVNRSEPVTLRCIIDVNPSISQIKWYKNQTEISDRTELHIDRVERNHSGIYTCIAFNRFSNNQTRNGSARIELVVQSRPIIETTYSKLATEVNQAVTLTCRVLGEPKANIYWKFHEQVLPCDEIVNEICYLRFSKVTKKDFGMYQCIAENFLGKEEWTYQIVSRGKPETPTNILVSDIASSSFKIQFSPSFDGGSGSQQFHLQLTDSSNSTILTQQIPFNHFQYTIENLNESTLYYLHLKSSSSYGDSPWSHRIPVQTIEFILKAEDLPQLYSIAYNSKAKFFEFDYLPENNQMKKIPEDYLCLTIRQSSDGKLYQLVQQCLPVKQQRVSWTIHRDFPFLKLAICSRKSPNVCGQEIEMREETNNRYFTPMIIGIVALTNVLFLFIVIFIICIYCRFRNKQTKSDLNTLDKSARPIISSPRLQNPYLLYNNSHTSSYDYEYQQNKLANSFSHPYDIIDRPKSSPQSNSNPSSESSCITQNTTEIPPNYYGFPPIKSPSKYPSTSSSSESSTPNRIKKLFYEVVV